MKEIEVMNSSLLQFKDFIKIKQGSSGIGFKIPEGMIEVKEEMTIFDFGLQISDFRFAKKPK